MSRSVERCTVRPAVVVVVAVVEETVLVVVVVFPWSPGLNKTVN